MSAAVKLKEHPLVGMATVAILGKRRSINEVPWFYRTILRWVFKRIKWASTPDDCNHSSEIQMVATDADLARAHMEDGWYIHTGVPVNVLLPDETCWLGEMEFKGSPMNRQYKKIPCDTVAIKMCDLQALTRGLDQRVKGLSKATNGS
jgi:hypothetical protein